MRVLALISCFVVLSGCSNTKVFQSEPVSTEVRIDGDLSDWANYLHEVDDHPANFGVRHDGEFVYVAFSTSDENLLRQVVRGGLTVWFNNSSDKSEQFGIRFPVGRPPQDGQETRPAGGARPEFLSEYEILSGEDSPLRVPVGSVPGISLTTYLEFGSFTYEVRVPLRVSTVYKYGVRMTDSGMFGLGFVTEIPNFSEEGRTSTGGGGGGRGRSGGGGRGSGGGRGGDGRGGGGQSSVSPIDMWLTVSTVPATPE